MRNYYRPTWDKYFLSLAAAVSERADCSRRRVGAVLVRPDRSVASTGYNGSEPGGPSCLAGECPRGASGVAPGSSYDTGPGTCVALHAELNCLAFAREDTTGYTLYCTDEPCGGCLKVLKAHRVSRYVWGSPTNYDVEDF